MLCCEVGERRECAGGREKGSKGMDRKKKGKRERKREEKREGRREGGGGEGEGGGGGGGGGRGEGGGGEREEGRERGREVPGFVYPLGDLAEYESSCRDAQVFSTVEVSPGSVEPPHKSLLLCLPPFRLPLWI